MAIDATLSLTPGLPGGPKAMQEDPGAASELLRHSMVSQRTIVIRQRLTLVCILYFTLYRER